MDVMQIQMAIARDMFPQYEIDWDDVPPMITFNGDWRGRRVQFGRIIWLEQGKPSFQVLTAYEFSADFLNKMACLLSYLEGLSRGYWKGSNL